MRAANRAAALADPFATIARMNADKLATGIGLLRDLVAATLGLLILFGVDLTDAQISGVLLVVTTFAALATWLYAIRKPPAPPG